MKSVYDILSERGFVEQVTDEAEARRMLAGEPVSYTHLTLPTKA